MVNHFGLTLCRLVVTFIIHHIHSNYVQGKARQVHCREDGVNQDRHANYFCGKGCSLCVSTQHLIQSSSAYRILFLLNPFHHPSPYIAPKNYASMYKEARFRDTFRAISNPNMITGFIFPPTNR